MRTEKSDWSKSYIHRRALNINFLSLLAKLTIFSILVGKHSGQLLNEIFIYSKDLSHRLL